MAIIPIPKRKGDGSLKRTRTHHARSKLLRVICWRPPSRFAPFHGAREFRSRLNKTKLGLTSSPSFVLAERGRFELPVRETAHRFSRAAPSTTQTPLLRCNQIIFYYNFPYSSVVYRLAYNAPMNGIQKFTRGVALIASSALLLTIGLATIFVVLNVTTWQEVFSWLWDVIIVTVILTVLCIAMAYLVKLLTKR